MIETINLTRRFGDKIALDKLNLKVEPGEILGFLGPNGAGKTTTVKILTGMIPPTLGFASVCGFDILKEPMEVKKRIGYVPETGALYETLTPAEYLETVACLHHLDIESALQRAREFLQMFGILDSMNQRMSGFSKGMKQKVLITSALLHNPDVLFLDEPLNGLDANVARIVKDLLRRLADQGKIVFFSSHILEVVERICSRIVVIYEGKQIVDGTVESITRETETSTLEEAFCKVTGVRDSGESADNLLAALDANR